MSKSDISGLVHIKSVCKLQILLKASKSSHTKSQHFQLVVVAFFFFFLTWSASALDSAKFLRPGKKKIFSTPYTSCSISVCLFSFHLFVPVYVLLFLWEAHCFANSLPGTVKAETETGWNTLRFEHSHSTCVLTTRLTREIWSGFRVSLFAIWYQRVIPAMAEHAGLHGRD